LKTPTGGNKVTQTPVISSLGRRLRLAVIGGGPGSMIGEADRINSAEGVKDF